MTRRDITLEMIKSAAEQSPSMKQAADLVGIPYNTFIRYAKRFGLCTPNQGLAGAKKPWRESRKLTLEDLLKEDVSTTSSRLKAKLFVAGLLREECSDCGIGPEWNGKKLTLQLDHVDGNRRNNLLINLRILCPNCHSQTDTFCRGQGKNYAGVAEW